MQGNTRHDEKLALILRTAAAVFAEKGYDRASIRDISRATGVSLSGLYYYFRSKEELLFLIQDHCFRTILDNLESLLEGVADPRVRLRLLVENHLRFFVSNMKEMKVLSHEADSLSGEYLRDVSSLKRRYVDLCAGTLEELRPQSSPIDPRVATFALFGMMNWIYTWYRAGRDVPVDELVEDICQLFLHGYLADAEAAPPAEAVGRIPGEPQPSIWRHKAFEQITGG